MTTLPITGRAGRTLVSVATILLLLLTGCTEGPEENDPEVATDIELPEWLDSVSPVPGAEAAPTDIIEVQHNVRGDMSGVRMIINGTDVTAYAMPQEQGGQEPIGDEPQVFDGEGLLSYDPNSERVPVTIDPGDHTVTLERVELPEEGAQANVLDTFEWSFTVR